MSIRKNAVCSIQWPILETFLPIGGKSCRYFLHQPSYSQFCLKFCWHGNGGQSGKNAISSIRWHIPETQPPIDLGEKISQKSPTCKPSYSQFCPKFRCHGNGGRSRNNTVLNLNRPAMLHQATFLFLRSTAGLLSTSRSRQEQSAPAISAEFGSQ